MLELVPHRKMWADLRGLVGDGVTLSSACVQQRQLPWAVVSGYLCFSATQTRATGVCTINRPLIAMHDWDLPTYFCARGRLDCHAPVWTVYHYS